jgi:hypothetical protein
VEIRALTAEGASIRPKILLFIKRSRLWLDRESGVVGGKSGRGLHTFHRRRTAGLEEDRAERWISKAEPRVIRLKSPSAY